MIVQGNQRVVVPTVLQMWMAVTHSEIDDERKTINLMNLAGKAVASQTMWEHVSG